MKKSRDPKGHIKHSKYKDKNISSIDDHTRKGRTLTAPLMTIGNMRPSSWLHERMPNILWACVLAGSLPRPRYLALFRATVITAKREVEDCKSIGLTHNFLATLDDATFDCIFGPLLREKDAADLLRVLTILDSLPDRHHWRRNLGAPENPHDAMVLAKAVSSCADHQGEAATDVRWLKLIHSIIVGRMFFGSDMSDLLEDYRLYPDRGDSELVAASIRAAEIAFVTQESGTEEPFKAGPSQHEEFWQECLARTECILPEPNPRVESINTSGLLDETVATCIRVSDHFDVTMPSSRTDARHQVSFGLALYVLQLLAQSGHAQNHTMTTGKLLLRSIVEISITFRHLVDKDDADLWQTYQSFGMSQAKLSFLKALRTETLPHFLDLDAVADYVNEDTWLEFQNIELGNWSGANLRKTAEEVGLKETYDSYYDVLSSFAHGHWLALRDSTFDICRNPLHRYHRTPAPMLPRRSTLFDAVRLTNAVLADLNRLYPGLDVEIIIPPAQKPKNAKSRKKDARGKNPRRKRKGD